jgi:glycosyltransferase involved in cell wall biosynthesis
VLEGENIICFAKDWSEDPTSNNHVMRLLARKNRVLWLNSIATRAPKLSSSGDLLKMGRKLRDFTRGPVEVAPNLFVYTPIVLPFPHLPAASTINQGILRATLALLRRKLGIDRYQLWSFIPTALPYLGMPGEDLAVYYCTDEWSRFSQVDGERIGRMERELCRRADVVFTTARTLWDRKRGLNPETHLALHGVDHEHFARALDEATPVAEELANCRGPVVGFFGLVHDWIDLSLLAHVAQHRPDWTVAVIGKANVDLGPLRRLPNVKLLGRRPYEELPRYCKAFSVGVMPFALNELTVNVNPIKMREYLSAGLPVVSTDLPEVRGYSESVRVAHTPDDFLAACEEAITADSPALRRRRSEAMAGESWEAKVAELGRWVRNGEARRQRRGKDFGPGDGEARAAAEALA